MGSINTLSLTPFPAILAAPFPTPQSSVEAIVSRNPYISLALHLWLRLPIYSGRKGDCRATHHSRIVLLVLHLMPPNLMFVENIEHSHLELHIVRLAVLDSKRTWVSC
ncbi:hypothetical protein EV361DRAFT_674827 [Lentinula raphanica]|nr:hypothetical protein EV361DRAFT_674827 [Lentinula raphanica]